MKQNVLVIAFLIFTPLLCLAGDPVPHRASSSQRPAEPVKGQEGQKDQKEKKPESAAQNGQKVPGEPVEIGSLK